MSNSTIKTRIQLRNDTAANWANSTVKIYKGEAALSLGTDNKYEIRIGTSAEGSTWAALASSNLTIPAGNVVGLSDTQYTWRLTESAGVWKLQKKVVSLPDTDPDTSASNWSDVSTVTLGFADGTDAAGYNASTNPIALKAYVDEEISDAIEALDTPSNVGIASISSNVVTLTKAISESDGIVGAVTGEGSTITLEEVAVTGAAADVSIADAGDLITATTVEGALQEIAGDVASLTTDSVVTMETADSGLSDGILKAYSFYQGLTGSEDATAKAAKLVGVVNIPKDLVVTSGSVVVAGDGTGGTEVISGATAGDKYLKLVIANQTTPIYIAVKDLVDVYTGTTNATGITITVGNDNSISATCNISGSATIATVSSGVVTIKAGVTQSSGSVSNSSDSDIVLAKVATTGAAGDISIADAGSKFTGETVEAALQEVAATAQSALQSISHGTDGDYVTTTVGAKSNNDQSVGVAVTVQAVATADSTHMGLAEASDVKTYADTKSAYLGTATALTTNTAAVTINSTSVTPNKGDVVTYSGVEYFWNGSAWTKLNGVQSVSFAGTSLTVGANGALSITKSDALTALNVEDGAQVNVIETVKVGGVALTPDANKAVDIDNVILDGGSASATIA